MRFSFGRVFRWRRGSKIDRQGPTTGPGAETPPAASGWKKWCFRALLLVILVPVVELASWIALRVTERDHSLAELYANQQQLAAAGSGPDNRAEVIHPYLGWTMNPQTQAQVEVAGHQVAVNALGFVDDGPGLLKRSSERFIVGIAGGSVAQQLSVQSRETLARRLSEIPGLRGRKIEVVRMAMSGYKQPQQLMALNYLLALGAEFDVVVNIDGYNELALSDCENHAVGVFTAYPRAWHVMTKDIVDPRKYAPSYRLLELRANRQSAAAAVIASPLRHSPTRKLIWRIRDASMRRELTQLGVELMSERKSLGRSFVESGPAQLDQDETSVFEHIADLWRRSSLQMHHLCRGNGINYIHVLQPNQYVTGSKPLGDSERRRAVYENQGYGRAVRQGYPLLLREGERLRRAGVDFHDLTRLFESISEPIYIDLFCHYNQQGNDLLAGALADIIRTAVEKPAR